MILRGNIGYFNDTEVWDKTDLPIFATRDTDFLHLLGTHIVCVDDERLIVFIEGFH